MSFVRKIIISACFLGAVLTGGSSFSLMAYTGQQDKGHYDKDHYEEEGFQESLRDKERTRPLKITFINPGRSNEVYWLMVCEYMKRAAQQLGVDLEILTTERNHFDMVTKAQQLAQRKDPPDYLLMVNEKSIGPFMLKALAKTKIKTLIFNSDLTLAQKKKWGKARGETLPNWIGSLVPNHKNAGAQVMSSLIEQFSTEEAKKAEDEGLFSHHQEEVQVLAIGGSRATPASKGRVEGLKEVLAKNPRYKLKQLVYAEWDEKKAYERTEVLLKRYPKTKIIWAANDAMAIGALKAVKDAGLLPGKDIFLAGLNWAQDALTFVKRGELVSSTGGHFLLGAWALIVAVDHHHGLDFWDEGPVLEMDFQTITQETIDYYLDLVKKGSSLINFKKATKLYNKALIKYEMSFPYLLKGLFDKE